MWDLFSKTYIPGIWTPLRNTTFRYDSTLQQEQISLSLEDTNYTREENTYSLGSSGKSCFFKNF